VTNPLQELQGLSSIGGSALTTHLPEPLARDTPNYLVEYGIRLDDLAMVFHFFPPKDREDWDPARWNLARRLEVVLPKHFDTRMLTAGYAPEIRSFYVIVGGLGAVPDPWFLVERFFGALDAAPVSAA
jgi:hypothetical protein